MDVRSVARRTSHLGSPGVTRARSAERSMRQVSGVYLDFEPPHSMDEYDKMQPNRERASSTSSMTKQVRSHRRAMSDPFDTAEMEGITDKDQQDDMDHGLMEEAENALPTLARFPFAETNNKNCWSEPSVGIFSVRGPDYLRSKKKITAKRYLLTARGCDLFLSDKPNDCKISK